MPPWKLEIVREVLTFTQAGVSNASKSPLTFLEKMVSQVQHFDPNDIAGIEGAILESILLISREQVLVHMESERDKAQKEGEAFKVKIELLRRAVQKACADVDMTSKLIIEYERQVLECQSERSMLKELRAKIETLKWEVN